MYRITVCASKMPFPIQFTVHTWIVTEYGGKIDRFDVFGFKEEKGERHGYFYRNFNPPLRGCPIFALGKYRLWESRYRLPVETLYIIEGGKDSDAEQIYSLLHSDFGEMPFLEHYNLLLGPNSNSFVQWVLNYVAKGKYPLPKRAYGKNWKGK